MREWLEYAGVWVSAKILGALPRPAARAFGASVTRLVYLLRPRLRRAAIFNLQLAFPDWNADRRRKTIRALVQQAGWMAAEFAHFPRYDRGNIASIVLLEGFENFSAAQAQGKGVLFLTGHMSAWELAPFSQALFGHPLHFLARPIQNWRVNEFINRYRCLSGNQPINKNRSARAILGVLKGGGTVGILVDHNTSREEGVFVDFFGVPACTTTGLARFALHTGAAVVPGFLTWDGSIGKYRLRFGPQVELVRTGHTDADVRSNTARFTRIVEQQVRRYPEQWLWVHKRWKTRPPGQPPLYPF